MAEEWVVSMLGSEIQAPIVSIDDDGILSLYKTAESFMQSLEPDFLDELTAIYDRNGFHYKAQLDEKRRVTLVRDDSEDPSRMRSQVVEHVKRWTELDSSQVPVGLDQIFAYLDTVVEPARMRATPKSDRTAQG